MLRLSKLNIPGLFFAWTGWSWIAFFCDLVILVLKTATTIEDVEVAAGSIW